MITMSHVPLYDPTSLAHAKRPMRVAGFMSGSGTNIKKILARERELKDENRPLFEIVVLFSDKENLEKCKIVEIAEENEIPYVINDIWKFYRSKGRQDKRDLGLRREYDKQTLHHIEEYNIDAVALGGYMSIVTEVVFKAHPTFNVHPADLRIKTEEGKRKFVGDNAVRDAILADEKVIRSSVHLVTEQVDGGPLIVVSEPLEVRLPAAYSIEWLSDPQNADYLEKLVDFNQDRLKKVGDWIIFPKALELLAEGRVKRDGAGAIYIDGKPVPLVLERSE